MYEHCYMGQRNGLSPNVMDHIFVVDFEEYINGPKISTIRFYLTADEMGQKFINDHPTWKRNCTPLGLFVLQEWFWKIKILEIEQNIKFKLTGGVEHTGGGCIFIEVEAEIFDTNQLQNWLLPIVNFTNTHILDQLHAFYEEHPEILPSGARRDKIFKEFYDQIDVKRGISEENQRLRLKEYKPPTGSLAVFADESGDIGFKKLWDSYITTYCIIPEQSLEKVRSSLEEIIEKCWPNTKPDELHFNKIPEKKREAVLELIAKVVKGNDVKLLCFEAQKEFYLKYLIRCQAEFRRREEIPVNVVLTELLGNPKANVKFNFLSLLFEEAIAHIGIDSIRMEKNLKVFHDRKKAFWMNEALENGVEASKDMIKSFSADFYGKEICPTIEFSIVDSHEVACLWISDWVSREVSKWITGAEFTKQFKSIQDSILYIGFDNNGVKRGTKELGKPTDIEFPDIPRDIDLGIDQEEI